MRVTFDEQSHGQREPIQAKGQLERGLRDDVRDAGEEEEEVHGAVVPVGEIGPAVRLGAVQLQVGTSGNKLLNQYPWAESRKVTIFLLRGEKNKLAGKRLCNGDVTVVLGQRNSSKVPS